MKKDEVPQDMSSLGKLTNEVCYAIDKDGHYVQALSRGWEVKVSALDITWQDIEKKIANARQQVLDGEMSPIHFFMTYRMMDLNLVASYTGFWKWRIKQHLRPAGFKNLDENKLKKYAEAFNVSVHDLQTMTIDESKI